MGTILLRDWEGTEINKQNPFYSSNPGSHQPDLTRMVGVRAVVICVCVSMCVSIYMLGLHLCVYLCVSVCTGMCAYACVSVCVLHQSVCIYVCVSVCTVYVCVLDLVVHILFVWQRVSWTCVCVCTWTSMPCELTGGLDTKKPCIQSSVPISPARSASCLSFRTLSPSPQLPSTCSPSSARPPTSTKTHSPLS